MRLKGLWLSGFFSVFFLTTIPSFFNHTGINGEITYEIPSGLADGKFTIDSTTGVIVSTAELDRETIASYVLTIYAKDGAYPARYDVATVHINVADDNDHSPVFATDLYILSLPENQVASTLHTVVAQDRDMGINAALRYTILGKQRQSILYLISRTTMTSLNTSKAKLFSPAPQSLYNIK